MNIEETKKAIEVMQAYVDGKEIEVLVKSGTTTDWTNLKNFRGAPSWNWISNDYRVKRVPREIWVNEYEDYGISYDDKQLALCEVLAPTIRRTAVKYREVIEE